MSIQHKNVSFNYFGLFQVYLISSVLHVKSQSTGNSLFSLLDVGLVFVLTFVVVEVVGFVEENWFKSDAEI